MSDIDQVYQLNIRHRWSKFQSDRIRFSPCYSWRKSPPVHLLPHFGWKLAQQKQSRWQINIILSNIHLVYTWENNYLYSVLAHPSLARHLESSHINNPLYTKAKLSTWNFAFLGNISLAGWGSLSLSIGINQSGREVSLYPQLIVACIIHNKKSFRETEVAQRWQQSCLCQGYVRLGRFPC